MSDKKIFVVQPSLPPLEEYVEQLKDIWASGIMTHQGPKHEELKAKLKEFMGVPALTLFANGHLALELGLEALGVTGEVITTPFTFGSTTEAILRNGLTPVFCDIRPDDYTIDCDKIEDLITERTSAIVPVHVYGNLCDVERLQEIADRHHLKLIYDSAHAFGEVYKGKNVACYGDANMFSFHATKVFNTVEGGCLTYQDPEMETYMNALKQFGQIVGTEAVPYTGTNAKMTEVAAAMGLCNLPHFREYIQRRKAVIERYHEHLEGCKGIRLCRIRDDVVNNYAYFPVVFEQETLGVSRDQIAQELAAHQIFARKYFYPLCSNFEQVRGMGIVSNVPVAEYISERVLTLPCYSELALEDVDRICDVVLERIRKG